MRKMRTVEETLKDSKNLVNKIYENMGIVQTCDGIAEAISDKQVCFAGTDNYISLEKVLTDEQYEEVKAMVLGMIDKKKSGAIAYLDFLNGKIPAIPNPVFEAAVDDMVKSAKEEKAIIIPESIKKSGRPRTKLTDDDMDPIRELYTVQDKTITEVASVLGIDKKALRTFVEDHHMVKPAVKQNDPFADSNRMSKDEFKQRMLADQKKK